MDVYHVVTLLFKTCKAIVEKFFKVLGSITFIEPKINDQFCDYIFRFEAISFGRSLYHIVNASKDFKVTWVRQRLY